MKNNLLTQRLLVATFVISGLISSCDKRTDISTPSEQENTSVASSMEAAMSNMYHYHDSCVIAKNHSSTHLHHYDSVYHHHDSLFNHHHTNYHHGDTTHHHAGWHHGSNKHHSHDSLNTIHHHAIH